MSYSNTNYCQISLCAKIYVYKLIFESLKKMESYIGQHTMIKQSNYSIYLIAHLSNKFGFNNSPRGNFFYRPWQTTFHWQRGLKYNTDCTIGRLSNYAQLLHHKRIYSTYNVVLVYINRRVINAITRKYYGKVIRWTS